MMGTGIAYVSAKAGMQVVLQDVSLEMAEKGKRIFPKITRKGNCEEEVFPRKSGTAGNRLA